MRSRLYVPVLALFLLAVSDVWAQFNSSIEGVVSDSSGAVIPGADVAVTDLGTGIARHVKTSGDGLYRVLNLGLGKYSVTVEHSGFQTSEHNNVPVAAAEVVRVDV